MKDTKKFSSIWHKITFTYLIIGSVITIYGLYSDGLHYNSLPLMTGLGFLIAGGFFYLLASLVQTLLAYNDHNKPTQHQISESGK